MIFDVYARLSIAAVVSVSLDDSHIRCWPLAVPMKWDDDFSLGGELEKGRIACLSQPVAVLRG